MITLLRRLRDCTSGAALLEAAVVFPLVLTLMLGVIEVGSAFHVYHTADKAVRSAARYIARVPEQATCEDAWGWENAKELAVFGTINPADGASPLIREWDTDQVDISFPGRDPVCSPPPPDDELVVRIDAEYPMPLQLMDALGLPSPITIRVSHEERHIGG